MLLLTSATIRKQIKDNFPDLTPEQIETTINNELLARNNVYLKEISTYTGGLLTITLILITIAVLVALIAN